MTDYQVTPEALRNAATGMDGVAEGNRDAAGALQPPNPLMFGMILGPLMAPLAAAAHIATGHVLGGLANMNSQIGAQLVDTAKKYDEQEEASQRLIRQVLGGTK